MRMVRKHGAPFLLLVVGIALGFFLSAHWVPNVSAVGRQDYESLEAFSNILSIVKKNYVDDVQTKSLVSGAINGMAGWINASISPERCCRVATEKVETPLLCACAKSERASFGALQTSASTQRIH